MVAKIDKNIKQISTKEAFEILEEPLKYKGNRYIFKEKLDDDKWVWVGFDNMDGCCWTAQHDKKRVIILWLSDVIDTTKLEELGGY